MKYYAIVSLFQLIPLSDTKLGSIIIAYNIYIISAY